MSAGQPGGLVGRVQRFGLATAAAVVDRYTVLAEQALGTDPLAAVDRGIQEGAPLADGAAGLAQAYLDLLAGAANAAAASADAPPTIERIILPPVPAGATTSGSLWLHNTTDVAVQGMAMRVGQFAAVAGACLPETAITLSPATADLDPGTSLELRIRIEVPAEQSPGAYHALALLGPGAHDPVVLCVVVLPGEARS